MVISTFIIAWQLGGDSYNFVYNLGTGQMEKHGLIVLCVTITQNQLEG